MPKYRFTWDAFDDATVEAVASACGFEPDGETARDWLLRSWVRPNEELVRRSRNALERTWLPDCPYLKGLVRKLLDLRLGPMNQPVTRAEHVEYISKCRNTSRFRELLLHYLRSFGEEWTEADVVGSVRLSHVCLDPAKQQPDLRKPFPYQQDAWDKLSASLAKGGASGGFPGLLVMPTGSGKTFTAARWLMENVVARGGRVMWVAHRQILLEQAYDSFVHLAGLAAAPERYDRLGIRIVSGGYSSATQLTLDDDIMLCSVASLARHKDVVEQIVSDPQVFLVIDEAHHAPAKSYRDIIWYMKSLKNNQLLGLTATPTRMVESERSMLSGLFNNNIIHQVGFTELVERGFLARPAKVRVFTDVEAEAHMTDDECRYLAQFDKLSDETLDRIGHLNERNDLIVGHYLQNKAKYGKTLVFATNVQHACLLREKFVAQGVPAEYVASYAPDGRATDKEEACAAFLSPDSGLDVLINVQMLTEGADLPAVQTVFLARPTNSEVLMQQMVGRALRGQKVGGTSLAYLVSFEDHWERFTDFERPFDLLPDLTEFDEERVGLSDETAQVIADEEQSADRELVQDVLSVIPQEVFRAVAAALSRRRECRAQVFEAVPCGWYVLERPVDSDDDVIQTIPVFNHDKPCWDALLSYLRRLSPRQAEQLDAAEVCEEYFGDCDIPRPSQGYVEQIIAHRAVDGSEPQWEQFAGRATIDPAQVARELLDLRLPTDEAEALVAQRYDSALAKAVYPDYREYWMEVNDAVWDLRHPGEAVRKPPAIPVFEPLPTQMMAPGPAHDLEELMASVLRRGAELLNLPMLPGDAVVLTWTKRLIKGWYAMAHEEYGSAVGAGLIRVNILLDSPDISRETMEYLLWHEYLHLWLKQGHTKEFRRLEKMWPTHVEGDRELFTLNERFGVSFW